MLCGSVDKRYPGRVNPQRQSRTIGWQETGKIIEECLLTGVLVSSGGDEDI